jgi:hypothetical protein
MKLFNYFNSNKFPVLFILFIIFYFLFYGCYGLDDADGGYTLALSWRIFNGEIPYRDFILVRPPLSPFFHSLPMYIVPANYQIISERLFSYLLFATSSLFGALTVDKVFRPKGFIINKYLLALTGFVFSVHNWPPMAWHTVDGIFFASIGIYILVCFSSLYSVVSGILFLFLSALCKQPFYLLPVAGIVFVSVIYKDRKKIIASVCSLLFFAGVFFLILYKQNTVISFIKFTSESSTLEDLVAAGFINYLKIGALYFIFPFVFWLIVRQPFVFRYLSIKEDLVPYFFISITLLFPLSEFAYVLIFKGKEVIWSTFIKDRTANILFLTTIFFLLSNLSLKKERLTLWFLILVSWCASLSWGYQTPVLFSIPLITGFLLVSSQYFKVKKTANLALYTLLLGSLTYFVAYQKPYQNPMRYKLTYKINQLFPKLKYIKVSKETYDKYTELASLVARYGVNFKTLPGIPISNYLTNTNSPAKIDWVFNAETGNENENNNIINSLALKNTVIFMEKNPQLIVVSDSKEKFNSSVAYFIKTNWRKIDSTNYFEIYRH